jgi:hypothetical protein
VYGPDSNGPSHFWPDDALEKVFLSYWNARLSWNWEEARKMEAPYFQEMTPPSRYKVYLTAGRRNQVKEIGLLQFNWEDEQLCTISTVLQIQQNDGKIKEVHLSDYWVKAGSKWYHVIKDSFFFPGV